MGNDGISPGEGFAKRLCTTAGELNHLSDGYMYRGVSRLAGNSTMARIPQSENTGRRQMRYKPGTDP